MGEVYLITGATGFIGANVVRELVKMKKKVCIITRDKKLNWRLKDIKKDLEIHQCDILSPKLAPLVRKINPDYIFHFASYGVSPKENKWQLLLDTNLNGTTNLLNAVKNINFKLFINAGSCFEYGALNVPMKESLALNPFSDYGVIKAATTLVCKKFAIVNNLPIITFRLFTPYGYYEDKNRLISSSISSALRNDPIRLSFPRNSRNFIFIDDIVSAYIRATQVKFKAGEVINIASNKTHTVKEVANTIIRVSKSKSKIIWLGEKKQTWKLEHQRWDADISKAKKILGWKPTTTLASGIKKTLSWAKAGVGV